MHLPNQEIKVVLPFCGDTDPSHHHCVQWIKHTLTLSARPLFIHFAVARLLVLQTTKGIRLRAANHLNLVRLWLGEWLLTDVKGEALRAVRSCHGGHAVRQWDAARTRQREPQISWALWWDESINSAFQGSSLKRKKNPTALHFRTRPLHRNLRPREEKKRQRVTLRFERHALALT